MIKVYAIARNEGAYLTEFVSYHFALGVPEIEIYVNKTDDNSLKILKLLSSHYENLKYSVVELTDIAKEQVGKKFENVERQFANFMPIQGFSYNRMMNKHDYEKYPYLSFIDIDEFIYIEGDKSLLEIIEENTTKVIHIPLIHVGSEDKKFAKLSEIEIPFFVNDKKMIFAKTNEMLMDSTHTVLWTTAPENIDEKTSSDIFLIHRNLRSLEEYKAMFCRGDTVGDSDLKINRFGWKKNIGSLIDSENFIEAKNEYDKVVDEVSGLLKEIEIAQEKIISDSDNLVQFLSTHFDKDNEKTHKHLEMYIEGTDISLDDVLNK